MEPSKKNSISSNRILTIDHDMVDTLWIGYRSTGLSKFNTDTGVFTHYFFDNKNKKSLSSNRVFSLLIDKDKKVWIGTLNGLNKFDEISNEFKRYYIDPINKNNGVNCITKITEDNKGFLWICSPGGLSKMDKNKESFKNYNSINTITMLNGSNDHLWLGTRYNGLAHFNKKNGKIKFYSRKEGTPKQ